MRAAKELEQPLQTLPPIDLPAQQTDAQRQAKGFSDRVQQLIGEACELGRRLREKPVQAAQARRLENNYQQRLQKICARALAHLRPRNCDCDGGKIGPSSSLSSGIQRWGRPTTKLSNRCDPASFCAN